MISSELLANKIQEIMGAQYKCVPFHLYLQDYTQPYKTPDGIEYTTDAQAFEIDKGIIPCVIKCTEARPNSAPYEAKSLTYEATFSVPQNITKRDKNGEVIEPPEFDFFGDYRKLWQAVNFKELTFDNKAELEDFITINYDPEKHSVTRVITPQGTSWWVIEIDMPLPFAHTNFKVNVDETEDMYFDYADSVFSIHIKKETLELQQGETTQEKAENFMLSLGHVEIEAWRGMRFYKGRMTVGEPAMIGREYDKQERLLWRVTGNFEVYAENVRTGADIGVKVLIDGTWHGFENMTNITLNADRNGNINQETAQLSGNLIASTKANSIAFNVDDVGDSALVQWLRDMSDKNDDTITSSALKHKKRKVKAALYRSGTLRKEFWAVPAITYNASSVADVGVFSVVLSDDGMEE